jgi:hypothetical protein
MYSILKQLLASSFLLWNIIHIGKKSFIQKTFILPKSIDDSKGRDTDTWKSHDCV